MNIVSRWNSSIKKKIQLSRQDETILFSIYAKTVQKHCETGEGTFLRGFLCFFVKIFDLNSQQNDNRIFNFLL